MLSRATVGVQLLALVPIAGPWQSTQLPQPERMASYAKKGYALFGSVCAVARSASPEQPTRMLVGDPGFDVGGYDGAVWTLRVGEKAASGTQSLFRDGEAGLVLGAIGDVSGDGTDDWLAIVGGAGRDPRPRVVVMSGRDCAVLNEAGADRLGTSPNQVLGSAGDVDGDSVADFWLCGVEAQATTHSLSVHSGRTLRKLSSVPTPFGGQPLQRGVALIDLDGKGGPEPVVGRPPSATSSVLLFVARSKGDDAPTTFAARDGECVNGASVHPMGRFDGDEVADLLVGSRWNVRVLSGRDLRVLQDVERPHDDRFGSAVCAIGDVTGDGTPDFLVSSPSAGIGVGRIDAFDGKSGGVLYSIEGPSEGSRFGTALLALGDLDGDAATEVVVQSDHRRHPVPGRVVILSGRKGREVGEIHRTPSGLRVTWPLRK